MSCNSKAGFLNLDIGYFGSGNTLCGRGTGEGSVVHCRMFKNTPVLYSLDANSTPSLQCNNENYLQILPNIPGEQSLPWLLEPLL